MTYSEIVNFLWGIADLIRDSFRRGEYQNVILPLTVFRRLDCVLAPTKVRVLKKNAELHGRLENLDPQLRAASGFAFYNTSRYDFEKLLADAPNLAANLRNYIAGFSENMRDVLEKFDFDNTIRRLAEAGLLFQVLERFKNVDLHPDRVPNPMMGTIFEELIRKFNEALNENRGEHFTPRDVVGLPGISDGQFLFLQHMLSHMHKVEEGGSRVAIIMNGSPLFTGDAGSGPSEIRRLDFGERLARSADRVTRAALLQHRHRDLCVGADESQSPGAQRKGPAHQRHRLLDADVAASATSGVKSRLIADARFYRSP